MFSANGNQMSPAISIGSGQAKDSEIVGFCAATGKDEFVRSNAKEMRQTVTRVVYCRTGLTPGCMHARWITEVLLEERPHRFEGRRTEWGSRVVIEVNHSAGKSCPVCTGDRFGTT